MTDPYDRYLAAQDAYNELLGTMDEWDYSEEFQRRENELYAAEVAYSASESAKTAPAAAPAAAEEERSWYEDAWDWVTGDDEPDEPKVEVEEEKSWYEEAWDWITGDDEPDKPADPDEESDRRVYVPVGPDTTLVIPSELETLIDWTRHELSTLEVGETTPNASADAVREYRELTLELEVWSQEGQKPDRTWTDQEFSDWGRRLTERGHLRRLIAGWYGEFYGNALRGSQETCAKLKSTLTGELASLEQIKEQLRRVDQMISDVEFTTTAYQVCQVLDAVAKIGLTVWIDSAKLFEKMTSTILKMKKLPSVWAPLKSNLRVVAAKMKKDAVQFEGYESLDELDTAITNTSDAILEELNKIELFAERLRYAELRHTFPVYVQK